MKFAIVFFIAVSVYFAYSRQVFVPNKSKNDLFCTVCKNLVDDLAPYVNNTDVEAQADKFCDQLSLGSKVVDDICKTMVHDSIGQICDDIKNGKSDKVICNDLGFC